MLNLLKSLRRKYKPVPVIPADAATAVLAKMRATTDDADLASFLDAQSARILREELPLYAEVHAKGIRLPYDQGKATMVKIHDSAFEMLGNYTGPGGPDISATTREGAREVAGVIDGMIRRALVLAESDDSVNRIAFYRLMMAQSQIVSCIENLGSLPPKEEKAGGDSA